MFVQISLHQQRPQRKILLLFVWNENREYSQIRYLTIRNNYTVFRVFVMQHTLYARWVYVHRFFSCLCTFAYGSSCNYTKTCDNGNISIYLFRVAVCKCYCRYSCGAILTVVIISDPQFSTPCTPHVTAEIVELVWIAIGYYLMIFVLIIIY